MSGIVSTSSWSDLVPAKNGAPVSINDVSYSPDGTRCVIAAGNRVLLYDASNGDLVKSLRGHEGTVYTVDFSADGTHFASGGADNSVVIWKSSGQGKLKYPHSAAIQRVKYNPVSFLLASCTDVSWTLSSLVLVLYMACELAVNVSLFFCNLDCKCILYAAVRALIIMCSPRCII
jgi:WD40 repeat protein